MSLPTQPAAADAVTSSDPQHPVEPELQLQVCRKLRTKLAFLPLINDDGERLLWQKGDGSTSVYWCLSTMECAGPDGGLAHATQCRQDRGCYRGQEA